MDVRNSQELKASLDARKNEEGAMHALDTLKKVVNIYNEMQNEHVEKNKISRFHVWAFENNLFKDKEFDSIMGELAQMVSILEENTDDLKKSFKLLREHGPFEFAEDDYRPLSEDHPLVVHEDNILILCSTLRTIEQLINQDKIKKFIQNYEIFTTYRDHVTVKENHDYAMHVLFYDNLKKLYAKNIHDLTKKIIIEVEQSEKNDDYEAKKLFNQTAEFTVRADKAIIALKDIIITNKDYWKDKATGTLANRTPKIIAKFEAILKGTASNVDKLIAIQKLNEEKYETLLVPQEFRQKGLFKIPKTERKQEVVNLICAINDSLPHNIQCNTYGYVIHFEEASKPKEGNALMTLEAVQANIAESVKKTVGIRAQK